MGIISPGGELCEFWLRSRKGRLRAWQSNKLSSPQRSFDPAIAGLVEVWGLSRLAASSAKFGFAPERGAYAPGSRTSSHPHRGHLIPLSRDWWRYGDSNPRFDNRRPPTSVEVHSMSFNQGWTLTDLHGCSNLYSNPSPQCLVFGSRQKADFGLPNSRITPGDAVTVARRRRIAAKRRNWLSTTRRLTRESAPRGKSERSSPRLTPKLRESNWSTSRSAPFASRGSRLNGTKLRNPL